MARRVSSSEVSIDVAPGSSRIAEAPESDPPFRLAILADFSGRENRGICEPLTGRRAVVVDRDNFDQTLAKSCCELRLRLAGGQAPVALRFAELDDFHPDRIFQGVGLFDELREARQKLADPKTFAAAAREMGVGAASAATPSPQEPRPRAPGRLDPASLASGSLLDQMIEETEASSGERRSSTARRPDEVMSFARRAAEPYLVPGADPRQPELVAKVDNAISDTMRALLHYRDFQALEAAWRAIDLLVRRVETGAALKLYLIDVSKAELARDLLATDDLTSTGAYEMLVKKTVGTPGAEPWSVLAGIYPFDATLEDIELLRRLALIGSGAGAPFLAGAAPGLLGCASLARTPDPRDWRQNASSEGTQAWHLFRKLPEARWAGLALPRFLLRLPYGRDTDSTEAFDFEEMPGPPAHEDYLWANPALACALLLANAFSDHGWEMHPGLRSEVGGLPLHVYKENGDTETKPCAEVLLTEEAVERTLEAGLMPLVSFKDRDRVRLARFQSVADPPSSLGGRWV